MQLTAVKDETTSCVICLLYVCETKPSSDNCTGTWGHSWMQTQINFAFIAREQSGRCWWKLLKARPCHLHVMYPTSTKRKKIWKLSADSINVHEPMQWRKCLPVSRLLLCHIRSQPSRWGFSVMSCYWLDFSQSQTSHFTQSRGLTIFVWDICQSHTVQILMEVTKSITFFFLLFFIILWILENKKNFLFLSLSVLNCSLHDSSSHQHQNIAQRSSKPVSVFFDF